jgi:hypothetical protein
VSGFLLQRDVFLSEASLVAAFLDERQISEPLWLILIIPLLSCD